MSRGAMLNSSAVTSWHPSSSRLFFFSLHTFKHNLLPSAPRIPCFSITTPNHCRFFSIRCILNRTESPGVPLRHPSGLIQSQVDGFEYSQKCAQDALSTNWRPNHRDPIGCITSDVAGLFLYSAHYRVLGHPEGAPTQMNISETARGNVCLSLTHLNNQHLLLIIPLGRIFKAGCRPGPILCRKRSVRFQWDPQCGPAAAVAAGCHLRLLLSDTDVNAANCTTQRHTMGSVMFIKWDPAPHPPALLLRNHTGFQHRTLP